MLIDSTICTFYPENHGKILQFVIGGEDVDAIHERRLRGGEMGKQNHGGSVDFLINSRLTSRLDTVGGVFYVFLFRTNAVVLLDEECEILVFGLIVEFLFLCLKFLQGRVERGDRLGFRIERRGLMHAVKRSGRFGHVIGRFTDIRRRRLGIFRVLRLLFAPRSCSFEVGPADRPASTSAPLPCLPLRQRCPC